MSAKGHVVLHREAHHVQKTLNKNLHRQRRPAQHVNKQVHKRAVHGHKRRGESQIPPERVVLAGVVERPVPVHEVVVRCADGARGKRRRHRRKAAVEERREERLVDKKRGQRDNKELGQAAEKDSVDAGPIPNRIKVSYGDLL